MKRNFTVSIALCTYNGEKYISQQLDSYMVQTILPDEIVVCDDRSSDRTLQIIQDFALRHPAIEWRIYQNEVNLKSIKNFEKAIGLCTRDIIFLCDQDDVWMPSKIEKMLHYFEKDTNALLLFSNAKLIDAYGKELDDTLWSKWGFTEQIQKNWQSNKRAFFDLYRNFNKVTGATLAFRATLKKNIFPIKLPENYWHDTWFALNAAGLKGLRFLNEPTIFYRIHPEQQVGVEVKNTPGRDFEKEVLNLDVFYKIVKGKFPGKFPEYTFMDRIITKIKRVFTLVLSVCHPDKLSNRRQTNGKIQ